MEKPVQENNKRRKENNNRKRKAVNASFVSIRERIKTVKIDKKQIITIAIILLIVMCIVIANNYTQLGLILNRNITSEDAIQIQLQTTISQILPCENGVLVHSKGKIEIYNNFGKNVATIQLEDTTDAAIATSGEYIQVINKDKNIVYVYKNKYEVARIKIDGKIYSGNINKNGTSVVEYTSNGSKIMLGVYDDSGNVKYTIRPRSNIIGKYVLSDNSKHLAYTDIEISGISVYTNVNLIDLSNIKEDGSNENTIYTLDNALAYDIYWDGKDVITRFDNAYLVYNTSSKKVSDIKISEGQVSNIDDYAKRFAYTELDGNGNYLLTIRKMMSDKSKNVDLDDVPKYFEYENGIAYVCYSKKIEAYNNFGVRIKKYDSDMVITEPVVFNDGRSIAMGISNKLIMFTI